MGNIIAAFQGHHTAPWTITERGFCNNVSKLCVPFGIPTVTAISLLAGPEHPMGKSNQCLKSLHFMLSTSNSRLTMQHSSVIIFLCLLCKRDNVARAAQMVSHVKGGSSIICQLATRKWNHSQQDKPR